MGRLLSVAVCKSLSGICQAAEDNCGRKFGSSGIQQNIKLCVTFPANRLTNSSSFVECPPAVVGHGIFSTILEFDPFMLTS